jgi:hypothetical protein
VLARVSTSLGLPLVGGLSQQPGPAAPLAAVLAPVSPIVAPIIAPLATSE